MLFGIGIGIVGTLFVTHFGKSIKVWLLKREVEIKDALEQ